MNENENSIKKLSKLRLKKSFVGLFFVILSVLSYQIMYLFILFIILSIVFSILGLIDKQKFSIVVLLLTIASTLVYFFYYKPNYVDPNIYNNILEGTWSYNEIGGTYVFNKDDTYYQYMSEDTKDNFCYGKYRYSFGVESEDGKMMYEDPDYNYYYLLLKPDFCVISTKKDDNTESKYDKIMVFGYGKIDTDKAIIINSKSTNISTLTKVK